MSTVSTLVFRSLDTSARPPSGSTEVPPWLLQASAGATKVQPCPTAIEWTSSNATPSAETDSGYASATAPFSKATSATFCDSSTDGTVLPGRKLFPRKVTNLKIFNLPISQATQNRFKDLSELFNKRLCDCLNDRPKAGVGDISIKLKILGESESTAQPWVVVQCRKDVEKKIRMFFNQRDVISEYQPLETDSSFPFFRILVRALPPKRRAAANHKDIYGHIDWDIASSLTLCGMIIKATQTNKGLIATIGGLIKVTLSDKDFILYGMTAGHIIPQEDTNNNVVFGFDSPSDEERNVDDNNYSLSEDETFQLDLPFDNEDIADAASITGEIPKDEQRNRNLSIPWSRIGHISTTSKDTKAEHSYDWALVEMEDASFYRPNFLVIPDTEHGCHIVGELKTQGKLNSRSDLDSTSKRSVVMSGGTSGFKRGILSASPSFLLIAPGKAFVKTYDLVLSENAELQIGDSGSWVIDDMSHEVYGHVVASDSFREAYVMPISDTFEDMKSHLQVQSVCLPDMDDIRNFRQRCSENTPILELSSILNNQAATSAKQENYKNADNLQHQVLRSRDSTPGPDHPETQASRSNLTSLLPADAEYNVVKEVNPWTFDGRENILRPHTPEAPRSMSKPALVAIAQGEDEEAEHSKAPQGGETVLEFENSETLRSLNDPELAPQDKNEKAGRLRIPTQISAMTESPTTVDELAHLVRLSLYQEQKCSYFRIRLERCLVSNALSARLARCGELAYQDLVEYFMAVEKKGFVNLLNAIHDIRNSCDATRQYALFEPDLENEHSTPNEGNDSAAFTTFLHEIPERSRETLLNFLNQIRTNPDYLASRIASLTSSELAALTRFHQGLGPIDSDLPSYTRSKSAAPRDSPNSSYIPTSVERLFSFQRHDPLSALIHTCFANSTGPDSAEDFRRTDIWATTCARLITESKPGTDPFICSVLNVWTTIRDWSGRSNLEWYLMKILEDGAFLLEKADEHTSQRLHTEPRSAKDVVAADEFYDSAIQGLFEVVDNPGSGVIPEGLIELGNAILRKLDPKRHNRTRRFLVSKWLFSVFLPNAIINPESYGMMSEYHITEYRRQKILKEVAMRSQRIVIDLTWNKSASTPLVLKGHIENIMACFRSSLPSQPNAKLFPTRSMISSGETMKAYQYLVLGPSDLITAVNALFPERHPAPSFLSDHLGDLRSGGLSISKMSSITSPHARGADNSSIISNSDQSSVISDATISSDLGGSSATSLSYGSQNQRLSLYEDDEFELRIALHEIGQVLGSDGTSGARHPYAERWVTLFISSDGQRLSTEVLHEHDHDAEEEKGTLTSDGENKELGTQTDPSKGYHQLRDTILTLVRDYEIPLHLHSKAESKTFSNRTSAPQSSGKKHHSQTGSIAQEHWQSKNPYRLHNLSPGTDKLSEQAGFKLLNQYRDSYSSKQQVTESLTVLISMLEAAEAQCQAQNDFINAHMYWKALDHLRQLSYTSLQQDGLVSFLNTLFRGPRDSIRRSAGAIKEYDTWLDLLKQSQKHHDVTIESMMKRLKALRDKMWYVTDVRNSAAYENSRNIVLALKFMALPKRSTNPLVPQTSARPRNYFSKYPKIEAEVMDIIAATEELSGPNKLSDEQSENTLRWLSQFDIENFCRGEERIHRFCLEIDACIKKLIGGSMKDNPVLWSSELFYRDKRILDLHIDGLGLLRNSGNKSNEADARHRDLGRSNFSRVSRWNLEPVSSKNLPQQSFDSGRFNLRGATTGDFTDIQNYFRDVNPATGIDSATTFWSPFQKRANSSSSASGREMLREERASMAKQRLLSDLKQTLTSLLISDLGTYSFSRGSETDVWFSGSLGQDCMERMERKGHAHPNAPNKGKEQATKDKRSPSDLRGVHSTDLASDQKGTQTETAESDHKTLDIHSTAGISSTSGAKISHIPVAKTPNALDFPYRKVFQQLLRMFSLHPSPYTKLNTLYELKYQIIAYLTSSTPDKLLEPQYLTMEIPNSSELQHVYAFGPSKASITSQVKTEEETINDYKKRRLHYVLPPSTFTGEVLSTPSPASTDIIVDILYDLFTHADIRPETLFRDLQFIASFVPADILNNTEYGKAFWDVGLAVLHLKQDVCQEMIAIADKTVDHNSKMQKSTPSFSTSLPLIASNGELMKYSLQDAAKMFTITAKEGFRIAQRELAICYLAHPRSLTRVIAPLSRPSETFKRQESVARMFQGEEREVDKGDRKPTDLATMCVAYHWMNLAALGGDELAKNYLWVPGTPP